MSPNDCFWLEFWWQKSICHICLFQYLVLSKLTNMASRVSSFKRVPRVQRSNIYPKKETHQLRGDLKFGASSGFGACATLMLRLTKTGVAGLPSSQVRPHTRWQYFSCWKIQLFADQPNCYLLKQHGAFIFTQKNTPRGCTHRQAQTNKHRSRNQHQETPRYIHTNTYSQHTYLSHMNT